MHISVRWESSYLYSQGVRLLHTELRVIPVDGFGQRRLSAELTLTPEAPLRQLGDAFGNGYHDVDFLEEVDHIHVALRAEVGTEQPVEPGRPFAADAAPLPEPHASLALRAGSCGAVRGHPPGP